MAVGLRGAIATARATVVCVAKHVANKIRAVAYVLISFLYRKNLHVVKQLIHNRDLPPYRYNFSVLVVSIHLMQKTFSSSSESCPKSSSLQ